jgi:hypothetical protein
MTDFGNFYEAKLRAAELENKALRKIIKQLQKELDKK